MAAVAQLDLNVVIMDLSTPELNGLDATQQILKGHPQPPENERSCSYWRREKLVMPETRRFQQVPYGTPGRALRVLLYRVPGFDGQSG